MSFDAMLGSSAIALKAYHESLENPETSSVFKSLSNSEKTMLAIKHPTLMLKMIKARGEMCLLLSSRTQDASNIPSNSDSAIYQSARQHFEVANFLYSKKPRLLKSLPALEGIKIVLSHDELIERLLIDKNLKKLSKQELSYFVTCLSLSGVDECAQIEEKRRNSLCQSVLYQGIDLIFTLNSAAFVLLFSRLAKLNSFGSNNFPNTIAKKICALQHYSFYYQVPNNLKQHQNQWLYKLGCTLSTEDQNNFQESINSLLEPPKQNNYIVSLYEPSALALAIVLDQYLGGHQLSGLLTDMQQMGLIQKWSLAPYIKNFLEIKDPGVLIEKQQQPSELKIALENKQLLLENQTGSDISTLMQRPTVSPTILLHYEGGSADTAKINSHTSIQENSAQVETSTIKFCAIL